MSKKAKPRLATYVTFHDTLDIGNAYFSKPPANCVSGQRIHLDTLNELGYQITARAVQARPADQSPYDLRVVLLLEHVDE